MKWYNKTVALAVSMLVFGACAKDDGPSVDDNFLNFDIPTVAVTEEFPVGVFYIDPGSGGQDGARYNRLTEVYDLEGRKLGPYVEPQLGNYKIDRNQDNLTDEMVAVVQQHVDWCINGGVDFLILPALKADPNKLAPDCDNGDGRFYEVVRGVYSSAKKGSGKKVDMKSLKFVATMNIEDPLTKERDILNADGTKTGEKRKNLAYNVLLEDNDPYISYINGKAYTCSDMFREFFKSIAKYFADEHYFRVNGKPMVVLQNPHKLFTKDCKVFYQAMRQAIKEATGEDVYLVAQQGEWTPPARFDAFYKGAVDAVTHRNMYNQGEWDRSLFYPQAIYLNWEYSREYFRDVWSGTDFIPTGAVAFYPYVDNSNLDKPIVPFDGQTFRTMCNVMKSQAGTNRIVFIDSFNQFQYSNFLEPTRTDYGNGLGTLFLDIVKEQFNK
jgi:hypothetical protein